MIRRRDQHGPAEELPNGIWICPPSADQLVAFPGSSLFTRIPSSRDFLSCRNVEILEDLAQGCPLVAMRWPRLASLWVLCLASMSGPAGAGQGCSPFVSREYHACSVLTHWLHKPLLTVSAPQNRAVRFRPCLSVVMVVPTSIGADEIGSRLTDALMVLSQRSVWSLCIAISSHFHWDFESEGRS
jgi:hypothetical protein